MKILDLFAIETAILPACWEIKDILGFVVQLMTVGIGILGVIGIVVAGIQYLTSAGNEEQARKSKRRIFEIIIGLFAYVVIYAALYWLLPDFNPSFNPRTCNEAAAFVGDL